MRCRESKVKIRERTMENKWKGDVIDVVDVTFQ